MLGPNAINPLTGVADSLTDAGPYMPPLPQAGSTRGTLTQLPDGTIMAQPVQPAPQQQAQGGSPNLPPGFVLDRPGPSSAALPPGFELDQQNAPGMTQGVVRAAASGVPIIGPLLNKADAATDAALSYALNPFFSKDQQLTGSFGERYNQALGTQNAMDTAFQQQHPLVAGGSSVAGGAASLLPLAGTGIGARLLGLVGGLPKQLAAASASGAAMSAADAALRGQDPLQAAVTGAEFGAAGPVAGRLVGKVAGAFGPSARKFAPSQAALDAAADRQYDAALNSNVTFRPTQTVTGPNGQPVTVPGAMSTLGTQSAQRLLNEGFRQTDAPAVFDIVQNQMGSPPGTPTSFGDMMAIYRQLGRRARMTNNNMERAATGMVMDDLRNYLANPPPGDVLSGDAQQAAANFRAANANYAAARGSQTISDKVDQALNQSGSAYSGMNTENTLRQKIRTILNNPKLSRGYSSDEIQAMQDFVRGAGLANFVRATGNLFQGGGGLGAQAEIWASLLSGHPLALGVPLAGAGIKAFGNMMANRAANNLSARVRLRAPAAAQQAQAYQAAADRNAALTGGAQAGGNLAFHSVPPFASPQPPAVLASNNQQQDYPAQAARRAAFTHRLARAALQPSGLGAQ